MWVCQHFPFVLCSNGGSQRHRAIFDAGEFAIEFSLQEQPERPLGEFWDELQSVKSPGERLRLLEGSVSAANGGTENHSVSAANGGTENHSWELSLAGAATIIISVACLSRQNTSFVATKVCLSRQNHVCRDKRFVVTNICRDKHVFVATKVILA